MQKPTISFKTVQKNKKLEAFLEEDEEEEKKS